MVKFSITNIVATILSIFIIGNFSCTSLKTTANEEPTTSPPPQNEQEANAKYTLMFTQDIKAKFLTTDKLQHSYLVTQEDELLKIDKEGKTLYTYSNFEWGNISHVDATNPFNILLYYGDFQTVVILDRTLNPTHIFDLFQTNAPIIQAIGMSDDQNVWIYDEANFRLKKINTEGEIIFDSNDLSLNFSADISPTFLLESDGLVFLVEENKTVHIFDNFAKFRQVAPYKITDGRLQTVDGLYVYLGQEGIYTINPLLGESQAKILVLPKNTTEILSAEIQQTHLFVLLKDKFNIYTFEKK